MIDVNNLANGLMGFYLIVALILLAIAIVAYPTLRNHERSRSKKSAK